MAYCYIFNNRGERLLRFNADPRVSGTHITIGRSMDNQICVARFGDMYVSRFHFELYQTGQKWYVKDCGSRWGIHYNDRKIKTLQMHPGDVIRFSHLFLGFGEKSGPSEFDLVWEGDDYFKEHRAALWRGRNTLGTSVDNSVTISDGEGIFRYHAVIEVINERRIVVHKNVDTALVSVNGRPIGAAADIKAGDCITLGKTKLKVVRAHRVNSDATIEIRRDGTGSESLPRKKSRGRGPMYSESEFGTRVIYGFLMAVVLLGLGALMGIILTLF